MSESLESRKALKVERVHLRGDGKYAQSSEGTGNEAPRGAYDGRELSCKQGSADSRPAAYRDTPPLFLCRHWSTRRAVRIRRRPDASTRHGNSITGI